MAQKIFFYVKDQNDIVLPVQWLFVYKPKVGNKSPFHFSLTSGATQKSWSFFLSPDRGEIIVAWGVSPRSFKATDLP